MSTKRYIPSSTRRALAKRAIGTAALLEQWADWLTDVAEAQGINLWAPTRSLVRTDGDSPITFKRRDVKHLIIVMRQRADEIRRDRTLFDHPVLPLAARNLCLPCEVSFSIWLRINRVSRNSHTTGIDLKNVSQEYLAHYPHPPGVVVFAHLISGKSLVYARREGHLLDVDRRRED